jgi:hypothetical protein
MNWPALLLIAAGAFLLGRLSRRPAHHHHIIVTHSRDGVYRS